MSPQDRELRATAIREEVRRSGSNELSDQELQEHPWCDYLEFEEERGDYGIVALVDDTPVGCGWTGFFKGRAHLHTEVPEMMIYVAEAHRGLGLGGQLIAKMIDHAADMGWSGLAVWVGHTNPARRLHARKGFIALPSDPSIMMYTVSPKVRRVAVYCGSATGENPEYAEAARELARGLAAAGIGIVYGGGNIGLMGVLADEAIAAGADIIGVIPASLMNREMGHQGLSSLEVVDTMAQRKTRMEELADAFIALPGGVGTLEEFFEVFTLQQLGSLSGPFGLYSPDGFWEPMVEMLRHLAEEGFLTQKYLDAMIVADNTDSLIRSLYQWRAPGIKWA